jgi:hypothetical protein
MANELVKIGGEVPAIWNTYEGPSGVENVEASDVSSVFLRLAQSTTGEAQPGTKEVKGLKPGMFFNSVSKRVYGESVRLIALDYTHLWREWSGDGKDGKPGKSYTVPEYLRDIKPLCEEVERNKKKLTMYGEFRMVDTREYVVLNYDALDDGAMLWSCTSSAIGASRSFLSAVLSSHKPLFAGVWKWSAKFTEGKEGSYYELCKPELEGWLPANMTETIIQAAKDARASNGKESGDDAPDWVK